MWFLILWLWAYPAVALEIITATNATPQAKVAAQMLREEGAARLADGDQTRVIMARRHQVAALLPKTLRADWQNRQKAAPPLKPEAYSLVTVKGLVVIAADDDRGLLFGAGHVLRKIEHGRVPVLNIRAEPHKPWRAHQLGYRFKNNSYDAFTLEMFEAHIRDLIVFGTNGIQWIAPISDDAALSPLYPAPPLDTLIGVSKLTQTYGIDFDLYYPEMAKSYADPTTVAAELKRFEDLVRQVPKIDALYVPGGDPGHTEPDLLFPLVAQQVKILHKYHPGATVWISAQGFDKAHYERFYALLAQEPDWLTGVFFGPQSRDGLPVQRARIPARYRLIFYPDIAHILHAQFPIPDLDPALALTLGREPVNPQPRAQSHIIRHFAAYHDGYVTYSEGVTDDVNKMIWSQAGWNGFQDANESLADYGRYFWGEARFGDGLAALERNWDGPVATNADITGTLAFFDGLNVPKDNWRYEMALYRATYDAYVQRRVVAETERERAAYVALGQGDTAAARAALSKKDDAQTLALRARLFDLAGRLYRHIGLQLSVPLYGASHWERGANLDRVDVSLNDRAWLLKQMDEIDAITDAAARTARFAALAKGDALPQGGFYDDLGDPNKAPRLVRGEGFVTDPQFYRSAITSIADMTPDDGWRMAWITYAEALYETPLEMRYDGLDARKSYRLKIVYAGEGYSAPIKLVADKDTVLHDFMARKPNPMTVEIDVPHEATKDGHLHLNWSRPDGLGGSGRGRQVAQVWLMPVAP